MWYKVDYYGSLYRIMEHDSTYKICTQCQKRYGSVIKKDESNFFVVN